MSSYIPRKPVGFDQESMFHMAVWDRLFGPEGQIHGSPNVKVSKTTKGIFIDVDPGRGGKNSPSSSSNQHCKITAISDLYFSVVTYYKDSFGTAHTGTTTIKVAKLLPMRIAWKTAPTTQTLLGITYTYTTVDGSDSNNYRRNTDPANNSQIEEAHRCYQVGDEIDIKSVDHTGVFIDQLALVITVTDEVPSMTSNDVSVTLTQDAEDETKYSGTIGTIAVIVTMTDGVPTLTANEISIDLTENDGQYSCLIGGTELTRIEDVERFWARIYAQ